MELMRGGRELFDHRKVQAPFRACAAARQRFNRLPSFRWD
jgi:hypothetical protein